MQTTYRNYRNYTYQRDIVKEVPIRRAPVRRNQSQFRPNGSQAIINKGYAPVNNPARSPARPLQPIFTESKKKQSYLKFKLAGIFVFIVLSGIIGVNLFSNEPDNSKSNASSGAVLAAKHETKKEEEPPIKKTADLTNLQPQLKQIIKKYPYDTSVSVVELNSGAVVQAGDSYPYVAASTTKILTALLYLHNVEQGSASLDEKISGVPAKDLLQKMVNRSDNDAWTLLNGRLTKSNLSEFAKAQGLTSYDPAKNTVTSTDMAKLLAKFYTRGIINESNTKLLLSWMQNTSEEQFISPAIPSGVNFYHKAGYLQDRAHDVAIIDNGSMPYVIVIYSKSYTASYDFGTGQKLFKEATTLTLNTFKG